MPSSSRGFHVFVRRIRSVPRSGQIGVLEIVALLAYNSFVTLGLFRVRPPGLWQCYLLDWGGWSVLFGSKARIPRWKRSRISPPPFL